MSGRRTFPILELIVLLVVVASAPGAWLWLDVSRPSLAPTAGPSAGQSTAGAPSIPASTGASASTDYSPIASPKATIAPVYGGGAWSAVQKMPVSLWGAGAAPLPDGRILVVGGATSSDSRSAVASAEIFDPSDGTWTPATSMLQPRAYPMVTALANGTVLVAGGSRNNQPLDSAELYYPDTRAWYSAGRMTTPRTHGTATLLRDGRVLLAGGGSVGSPDYTATATAELFDPATLRWTDAAPMHVARSLQAATLLSDGNVLVTGGASVYYHNGSVYKSAEIYDPTRDAWHDASPMAVPRYAHSIVTLNDGRALAAGGWMATPLSDPSVATAETYDPSGDAWTSIAPMSDARAQFRMSVLPDGRVLAVGGVSPHAQALTSADLFDPGMDSWTPTGRLSQGVFWPILANLPDGRVLVAGGARNQSASQTTSVASVYTPSAP